MYYSLYDMYFKPFSADKIDPTERKNMANVKVSTVMEPILRY